MNKVIQANLGGTSFTFDSDAYAALDDYLATLNGYFRNSAGHGEIMHDIEVRLAELFTQNLKGRSVVNAADVRAATATLGTAEQLTGEVEPDYEQPGGRYPQPQYSSRGRKLMRDMDEKVIGGVCSGVSAYFGIDNPVWMRIAFAVAFFGAGIGLIPYVILWIAMPAARSASDKLAMRGDAINLDGISTQVERELTQIGGRLNEWGDEVKRTDWSGKIDSARSSWSERPRRSSRSRREDSEYMS